jgi:hypothetical protein
MAADRDTYSSLTANLPEVTDHLGMAREYLRAFKQFTGFRTEDEGGSYRHPDEIVSRRRVGGRADEVKV